MTPHTVTHLRTYLRGLTGSQRYVIRYVTVWGVTCQAPRRYVTQCVYFLLLVAHYQVGGRLYVIGGNVEDSYGFPVAVTSIEMFAPPVGLWTTLVSSINVREAGTAVLSDRIYIVGGINGAHYYSDSVQVRYCNYVVTSLRLG